MIVAYNPHSTEVLAAEASEGAAGGTSQATAMPAPMPGHVRGPKPGQNPVPIWNCSRWVTSPGCLRTGNPKLNFIGPNGDSQLRPTPTE